MKKSIIAISALFVISSALTGCATIDKISKPLAHETGVQATSDIMTALVDNKSTKEDVLAKLGHPVRKADVMGVETWSYDYLYIPPFPGQKNISESSTFEFSKAGVLTGHFKSNTDAASAAFGL